MDLDKKYRLQVKEYPYIGCELSFYPGILDLENTDVDYEEEYSVNYYTLKDLDIRKILYRLDISLFKDKNTDKIVNVEYWNSNQSLKYRFDKSLTKLCSIGNIDFFTNINIEDQSFVLSDSNSWIKDSVLSDPVTLHYEIIEL